MSPTQANNKTNRSLIPGTLYGFFDENDTAVSGNKIRIGREVDGIEYKRQEVIYNNIGLQTGYTMPIPLIIALCGLGLCFLILILCCCCPLKRNARLERRRSRVCTHQKPHIHASKTAMNGTSSNGVMKHGSSDNGKMKHGHSGNGELKNGHPGNGELKNGNVESKLLHSEYRDNCKECIKNRSIENGKIRNETNSLEDQNTCSICDKGRREDPSWLLWLTWFYGEDCCSGADCGGDDDFISIGID